MSGPIPREVAEFLVRTDPQGIARAGERILGETPRWRLFRRWRIKRAIAHFKARCP